MEVITTGIERRTKKLEKSTDVGTKEKVWLVVATGDLDKEQADAKVKAAIAEYRAGQRHVQNRPLTLLPL